MAAIFPYTQNELLDIELRNKDNADVRRLLEIVKDLDIEGPGYSELEDRACDATRSMVELQKRAEFAEDKVTTLMARIEELEGEIDDA